MDLVERLRSGENGLEYAAANEIERLRKIIIQAIADDATSLESMMQTKDVSGENITITWPASGKFPILGEP